MVYCSVQAILSTLFMSNVNMDLKIANMLLLLKTPLMKYLSVPLIILPLCSFIEKLLILLPDLLISHFSCFPLTNCTSLHLPKHQPHSLGPETPIGLFLKWFYSVEHQDGVKLDESPTVQRTAARGGKIGYIWRRLSLL